MKFAWKYTLGITVIWFNDAIVFIQLPRFQIDHTLRHKRLIQGLYLQAEDLLSTHFPNQEYTTIMTSLTLKHMVQSV